MSSFTNFDWNGERLQFFANGSLYLPEYRLLIISDLHLEKGAALDSTIPLPTFDTRDTLQRVSNALNQTAATDCILLGDSFHTDEVAWRLPAAERKQLQELSQTCNLHWVEGNHDPNLPYHIPGHHCAEMAVGPIEFRHMPLKNHNPQHEIIGHFHPKARLKLRAKYVTGKCFLLTESRLLMPAFGSYTGGLNIKESMISDIMPNAQQVFFCHQQKIYQLPFSAQNFT